MHTYQAKSYRIEKSSFPINWLNMDRGLNNIEWYIRLAGKDEEPELRFDSLHLDIGTWN